MANVIAKLDSTDRMYCTTTDISTRYDIKTLPLLDLEKLIRAITAKIESYTNRVFMRVPNVGFETRQFLGTGTNILAVDDLLEIDTITLDAIAVDVADLILQPFGKTPTTWLEYEDESLFLKRSKWVINGAWGYSQKIPHDVWDATVEWVVWSLGRARQGYQDASATEDVGALVFASNMPGSVRDRIDNRRRHP